MSWIYSMIMDGSYHHFKNLYNEAIESKQNKFKWGSEDIDTNYAKYVVFFIDKHLMKEYEEHLEAQAELYSEYEANKHK